MESTLFRYYILLIGLPDTFYRASILFNCVWNRVFGCIMLGSSNLNDTWMGLLNDKHCLPVDTNLVLSSVKWSKWIKLAIEGDENQAPCLYTLHLKFGSIGLGKLFKYFRWDLFVKTGSEWPRIVWTQARHLRHSHSQYHTLNCTYIQLYQRT